MKKIINIVYIVAVMVLIVIAVTTAFTIVKAPGGYQLFVVMSGSMEPSIKTGSVVLVGSQDKYKEGDVVTYFAGEKKNLRDIKATVTHRIVKTTEDGYTTKGDANNTEDRETVTTRSILGKVIFSVPYFGRVVAFSKTQNGFILLVIIPSTLIIYSELQNIKNEIRKMFSKKQDDETKNS